MPEAQGAIKVASALIREPRYLDRQFRMPVLLDRGCGALYPVTERFVDRDGRIVTRMIAVHSTQRRSTLKRVFIGVSSKVCSRVTS